MSISKFVTAIEEQKLEELKKLTPELINKEDDSGMSLLMRAILKRKKNAVKLLLELGANVNQPSRSASLDKRSRKSGETLVPLAAAAAAVADPDITSLLLEYKANPSLLHNGKTPLDECLVPFVNVDCSKIIPILAKARAKVSAELFCTMCGMGEYNTVKQIIDCADVNAIDPKSKASPLQHLCAQSTLEKEKFEIAKLLLEKGAKIDKNVVEKAIYSKLDDVCLLLLQNNANYDFKSRDGENAAILAAERNMEKTLTYLIEHKVNVAEPLPGDGRNVIMLCSYQGKVNIIQKCIDAGANVHHIDKKGASTLTWAIYSENTDLIALLLQKGVKTQLPDGRSVLDQVQEWANKSGYSFNAMKDAYSKALAMQPKG